MSTTIDLTKTVKEIITSIKSAIDSLNTDVASNKSAIDSLKSEILLAAHPVGSYYFSDDSTDPGTLFGGTWKALPAGYGVVAQGTAKAEDGSTLTFTAGSKYGEFKHQLTVGESASHRHVGLDIDNVYIFGWDVGSLTGVDFSDFTRKSNRGNRLTTGYTGGNGYHNNIAPCKAVYGWYRAN